MKKNRFKRVLSVALAAVMVAGTISFMPGGTTEVQASTGPNTINLRTGGLTNSGSKVYFGLDTSSTVPKVDGSTNEKSDGDYTKTSANNLWRVLDAQSGLLFADDIIAERRYDDNSNDWASSELYAWLNGEHYKGNTGIFSDIEKNSIATNTNGDIRLLTLDEVKKTEYGFTNDTNPSTTRAASSWWWLRSPGSIAHYAALVNDNGFVHSYGDIVYREDGSVRPAFNLNLSSVLFTSASGTSKSSFASVNSTSANTWKLTLKDISKEVSVTTGESVSRNGQTITVPYTYTGSDVSQISIMITDKAYTDSDASILYYGALTTTLAATGTGTFTLPGNLPDGYKAYMMSEDVNDGNLTDYSSEPVAFTIPAPVSTYHVTVSNGTGDGSYAKDASVTITADAAPSGQHFKEWTGTDSLNFTSGSKTSATATFTMPANAVTITATYENDTPTPGPTPKPTTPTYKIVEGAGGTWTSGTDGTLSFRGDGEVSKFKEVKVDGTVVNGSNYNVTEGSTIVTLKADYLKTLSVGNHTFELVWTDGSASTTFTVKEAATTTTSNKDDVPKTGDSTPVVWLFAIALISGIGILYFRGKRKTVR